MGLWNRLRAAGKILFGKPEQPQPQRRAPSRPGREGRWVVQYQWKPRDVKELRDLFPGAVQSGQFSQGELERRISGHGDPETWPQVYIRWKTDGTCVFDFGDGEEIMVGDQEEFEDIYTWLDVHDIDFDIIGSV